MNPLVVKIIFAAILMLVWTYRGDLLSFLNDQSDKPQDVPDGPTRPQDLIPQIPTETPEATEDTVITMSMLKKICREKPDLFNDLLPLALPSDIRELYEQD